MQENRGHRIVLGGIGGDSHSVGLTILRRALSSAGYQVRYLGIQSRVEAFLAEAPRCDAVMISNMDGHAHHYLRDFAEQKRRLGGQGARFYLGGYAHVGEPRTHERLFLEMGFDRVFMRFTDVRSVLRVLASDLGAVPRWEGPWPTAEPEGCAPPLGVEGLCNEPLAVESFERERREVLAQWSTGRAASSLEDNARFLRQVPSFSAAQREVLEGRAPMLIQPRSGVVELERQLRMFTHFTRSGARVLSYQVDSLTRNNDYATAEQVLRESQHGGGGALNGFPVVNHGVEGLRRIISQVRVPLQTRHSTRDPRLLAEVSYAGGVTAFEGGAICYNIPYYKDYPLEESVRRWQYVDRLTGLYLERFGVLLDREFFGTLTATLIPPSLAIAVNILEALLAVRQGVRCLSLGYAEQGNRSQDIAAIRMLGVLTREALREAGVVDVQINTVFHQYMAAFPGDAERAAELIYHSAVTAALSGATRMMLKTPVEALRIPSPEDNAQALELTTRAAAEAHREQVDEARVREECQLIRREVEALLRSVLREGQGDVARGLVLAFQRGYLDIPFSPSRENRGLVMTVRDLDGAVRFLSCGNLELDAETRELHREKVHARLAAEGIREDEGDRLVESDVLQVARGQYERWPLSTSGRLLP